MGRDVILPHGEHDPQRPHENAGKSEGLPPNRGQALLDYQLGTKKRNAMEVMMK